MGFLFLVALVLVTPEIVDAIAMLPWYVQLGQDWSLTPFNDGYVRLILSHSVFSTAVVTLIVRARLSGIDETLEEAAADLYATPARRFTQITFPLMLPAVLAGCSAGVHIEPGQHGDLVLCLRARGDSVAGLRLLVSQGRPET